MPTFDTIMQGADYRPLIRKIKKAVAFLAPNTVQLPNSLFTAGSLIDLKSLGWMPIGIVTPDGYEFGRDVSKSDVTGLGYASPVRSDVDTVARSVKVTPLEYGRRHMQELAFGTDLSSTTQDPTTGEIVFNEPDLPVDKEWRLLVIGVDGPADEQWILARGYPAVKLSATDSEKWGSSDPVQRPLTFDVFSGQAEGTPVKHYTGGTAAIKHAGVLGFTQPWAATKAYTIGARVSLTGGAVLEATVAGTTGSTAPTAPAVGATVVDGTVTWKRIS